MALEDKMEMIKQAMTPIQRRRYKLYFKRWTLTRIAKEEGVSVVAVWFSIHYAKKTIKKKLAHLKNT